MADIGSFNLKLHRSHDHQRELLEHATRFTQDDAHRLELKSDDASEVWEVSPRFATEPDTDRWALIFGDYVHCLRSALDHLVYALAAGETEPDPPPSARQVAMPLYLAADEYARHRRRLRDLSPTVEARIESLQPYADRPDNQLLRMLNELDARDKHRLISVVPLYPAASTLSIEGMEPGSILECNPILTPLRNGQPFMRLTFDRPAPDLQVTATAAFGVFVRVDDEPGTPVYDLGEMVERLFWATRWVSHTLLGDHVGGPVLPPPPLAGYHVDFREDAPELD